jgi:hypothetical protein
MEVSSPNTCGTHTANHQFEKPKYEVADILRLYLDYYLQNHKLSPLQYKVVHDIMACRTSKLGYHKLQCDVCDYERIEYDSCRNRHCPKCQGSKRLKWVNDRLKELLPIPYYHAVFTMVHSLNILALYNKEVIYDIFLKSCGITLKDFALDPKYLGAKIGFVGILHTWGQPLCLHVHAHFIIPGGGISNDETKWINLPYRTKFLFPVKAMSRRVRKIFSEMLQQAYDNGKLVFPDELSHLKDRENFKRFLNEVAWDKWINYVKKPFSTPEDVVKYIGRYTHRVAISNHRILDIADGKVTFKYKEYKDGEVTPKIMPLKAEEFIRRFLLHILPKGFKKIRYFGIFSNGLRKKYLQLARELLKVIAEQLEQVESCFTDLLEKLFKCPCCELGMLHVIEVFNPRKFAPG